MSSSNVLKHKHSGLLSADDNDLVFQLVGQNCQALSTTVIELHRNLGSKGDGDWSKEEVGVLCLVRDLIKKCHFFRIFCLIRKRKVWEYVIHDQMQYSAPDPFLHFFQVEEFMYAFYFVSEQEAAQMHEILVQVFDNYERKPNMTGSDKIHEINPTVEPPSKSIWKSMNRDNPGRRLINFSKQFRLFKMFLKKDDEVKKKKASKHDITPPRDFKHVSHICDFKERMNQIKISDTWNDKTSLKCPPSIPIPMIPPLTSTSHLKNASARAVDPVSAPALPEKKSPLFAHRRSPNGSLVSTAKFSDSAVLDMPPPLPEKKTPRMDRRLSTVIKHSDDTMQYQIIASVKPAVSEKEMSRSTHQLPVYPPRNDDDILKNKFTSAVVPTFPGERTAHLGSCVSTSISFGNDRMHCDFTATVSPSPPSKNAPILTSEPSKFKHPSDVNFVSTAAPSVREKKSYRLSMPKPSSDDSGHYSIIEAAKRSLANAASNSTITPDTSSTLSPTHFSGVSYPTRKIYRNVPTFLPSNHIFLNESTLPKKYKTDAIPPPPQIVSAEMKPSTRSMHCQPHPHRSSVNVISSSNYEMVPPPRPVTNHKSHSKSTVFDDTTQCHYDVITVPPRPILYSFNPLPPSVELSSSDKEDKNSPCTTREETSSNLVSQANAASTKPPCTNAWSQKCLGDSIRKVEPSKSFLANHSTTAHQFRTSLMCSTSPTTLHSTNRTLPPSLIADIRKGVKLKHVEKSENSM